jgi:hypothetical protein
MAYDPFVRGPLAVGVRTVQVIEGAENETCKISDGTSRRAVIR